MKKVLIFCYDFPPLTSAGAIRPYAWQRYARKYGYEATVICRHWPFPVSVPEDRFKTLPANTPYDKEETEFGTVYRVNHKNSLKEKIALKYGFNKMQILRRSLSLGELVGRFKFHALDDKYEMYKAARAIVAIEKPDMIIASGEPHILFHYAYKLYKEFNIPYILDYRDGWYTNQVRNRQGLLNKTVHNLELKYEKQSLAHSAFFISVTDQFVTRIQHEVLPHKGYIIANGVELSLYQNIKPTLSQNTFVLAYTGTMYDVGYDRVFIAGIRKFIADYTPTNFEIHFYGIDLAPNRVVDAVYTLRSDLPEHVKILPRKSARDIIQVQMNATALFLLIPGSLKTGAIAMKIYEYLASRRPIIVVPTEADRSTPVFPDKDYLLFALSADEFANTLAQLYTRFKNGDSLQTAITDEEIFSISREYSTKILLDKVTEALTQH